MRIPRFSLCLLPVLLSAGSLHAAGTVSRIRIGTLAPKGSSYDKILQELGAAWREDSGNAFRVQIYAGGTQGSERDHVALMKSGTLDAALLTAVGLSEIEPGVAGLQSIPMGFRDFAEVDYVGSQLQPMLEQRLAAKGFKVLFWMDAGWVRFFTTRPVESPDDLRPLKLFSWAGNPELDDIYRQAGFDPRPLETGDLLMGMNTGMIEAAAIPPVFANATQLYSTARYMLDLNWAPLVGALVIRRETWERLPVSTRDAMQTSAAAAGLKMKENGRGEAEAAVATMVERHGLEVTEVTPAAEIEWRRVAESVYPQLRGTLVPADIWDRAMELLAEYRAQNPEPETASPKVP